MEYYYNPEVKLLLIDQSDEKEKLFYYNHSKSWEIPKIGPRPPYYIHPRYEQYFPII
jgi:hypothetical protein